MPNSPAVAGFYHEESGSIAYVVSDPATRQAAIIDPVLDFDEKAGRISTKSADAMLDYVRDNKYSLQWILDTHPHADHFSAAVHLKEKTGAPYCHSPIPPATYGVDWPMRGREYNRLALVLSAWMSPSPRRQATSVSTLSVDVTGNVTAVPTGDAPAEPSATYGVTSTVLASCAPLAMLEE